MNSINSSSSQVYFQKEPYAKPLVVLGGLATIAGLISMVAIEVFYVATFALPFAVALTFVGALCLGVGSGIMFKNSLMIQSLFKQMD